MTPDEQEWLETRGRQVEEHFHTVFERHAHVFPCRQRLLSKYHSAAADVRSNGWIEYGKQLDFHNELSLAEALLEAPQSVVALLEYEVPLARCAKRIDFRITLQSGSAIHLDVKTVRPAALDAWAKYEQAVQLDRLAPATHVELHRGWLGGELWHLMTAARAKFLEHSLALEARIRDCGPLPEPSTVVLALFSDGFRWHLDELEDFVCFYRSGNHPPFDPLGPMEAHYVKAKNININRSIDHFAFFRRTPASLSIDSGCWSVSCPRLFLKAAGPVPRTCAPNSAMKLMARWMAE